MSEKYYCQYKDGATITIFAPYDCNNNCPFCVNKKEYKENPTFDLDKVLESLEKLHNITPRCDIVITGGEPFADVNKLGKILGKIYRLNQNSLRPHKVFINTTLPFDYYNLGKTVSILKDFNHNITGLNVSRHVRDYVDGSEEIIEQLDDSIPIRINTVLANINEAKDYKEKVYDKYKDFPAVKGFQVRDDYTRVNEDNLYVPSDEMIEFLYVNKLIEYPTMSEAKRFYNENMIYSNDFHWNVKINDKISYHRTLPYSCIEGSGRSTFEYYKEINDIIINPRGEILDDWNKYGKPLDLMAYKNRTYKCYGNLMERLY